MKLALSLSFGSEKGESQDKLIKIIPRIPGKIPVLNGDSDILEGIYQEI